MRIFGGQLRDKGLEFGDIVLVWKEPAKGNSSLPLPEICPSGTQRLVGDLPGLFTRMGRAMMDCSSKDDLDHTLLDSRVGRAMDRIMVKGNGEVNMEEILLEVTTKRSSRTHMEGRPLEVTSLEMRKIYGGSVSGNRLGYENVANYGYEQSYGRLD